MSTRDELTKAIDLEVARDENWDSHGGYEVLAVGATERIADALIAEGWRKKPSREAILETFAEAAPGGYWTDVVDAILALMDRGQ